MTVNIPPDALGSDQTISLRVCGGDGPLLPPHQVLLSPVVIVGPNTVQFKKPIILAIPHCINYNLEPINPAVIKNNLSNERITPDNFYGWEIEVKPPGPQLKVCHPNPTQNSKIIFKFLAPTDETKSTIVKFSSQFVKTRSLGTCRFPKSIEQS